VLDRPGARLQRCLPVALLEGGMGDSRPGVARCRVVKLSRRVCLAEPFEDLSSPFPSVVAERHHGGDAQRGSLLFVRGGPSHRGAIGDGVDRRLSQASSMAGVRITNSSCSTPDIAQANSRSRN
jgi:hypothetical protein